MNVNDRGTVKWTSLMMPEHVELLKQEREKHNRKEKPMLDQQQIEENSFQLMMAHKDNLLIEVKHYKDYDFHYIKGYIDSINYQEKNIKIVDKPGCNDFTSITFDNVLEVFIL